MTTQIGNEHEPLALLTHLIEMDFDAIEAYDAAIARLEDTDLHEVLMEFHQDHQRHVRDLASLVHRLGGVPAQHPDMKNLLTRGRVVVARLAGDRAVLGAMKLNEEDTNLAYERASGRVEFSDDIHDLLATALEDERRHRAWFDARLRTS